MKLDEEEAINWNLHCSSAILTLDLGRMLVFDDQHMAKIKSQNDVSCCFLQFDQTNKVDGAMKNALKLKDARKVWLKQK